MNETPVINHDALMAQFEDDQELLVEVALLFLADYPRHVDTMRAAIDSSDAAAVEMSAHTLKGAVSNFAAEAASAASASLEAMGRAETLEGAEDALSVLETEMQRLEIALRVIIDESD